MSINPHSTARRALGLAALSGLALVAAPAAHAASQSSDAPSADAGTATAMATFHQATAGLAATPLYPLAHTPLDVLSNNLHVPVGGMDLSTFPVTAPFHDGLPLAEVPVVGKLLH
ncbi:hypothetical protein KGQ20_38940 [Catenulispora sp. NF23]|uniref:Secreted protein n=1 Tax=Catenulispora pinistramenti TaxID=2705254 RepID=A0ABS5L336_9ACTN|nr:hypothetical protein [Catenulispora pinistramenti]MBS2538740.1 hypothetical protein [Catenulispora pinistramenti]MBS2552640.1 hypothetical protein [Catenulispora pinistramenti]